MGRRGLVDGMTELVTRLGSVWRLVMGAPDSARRAGRCLGKGKLFKILPSWYWQWAFGGPFYCSFREWRSILTSGNGSEDHSKLEPGKTNHSFQNQWLVMLSKPPYDQVSNHGIST